MGVYSITEGTSFNFDGSPETVCPSINFMAEAFEVVVESNNNYNNIMKCVGIAELNYLEENGSEMLYEAGNVKALFARFVEFFKVLLVKVQGMFKKFFSLFAQFAMSDKDFAKKYEKDLIKVDLKGLEYKGYKFTPDYSSKEVGAAYTAAGVTSAIALAGKKDDDADVLKTCRVDENIEDARESLRACAANASGALTQKEFSEKLFSMFRGGEDKEDIKVDSVRPYLTLLTGSAKTVTAAKAQYATAEKMIKAAIKECETAESKYVKEMVTDESKGQKVLKAMTTSISLAKDYLNYVTMANGASLSAFKDQSRQAKAICVKALSHVVKKEAATYNEGVGAFLNNVVIK